MPLPKGKDYRISKNVEYRGYTISSTLMAAVGKDRMEAGYCDFLGA